MTQVVDTISSLDSMFESDIVRFENQTERRLKAVFNRIIRDYDKTKDPISILEPRYKNEVKAVIYNAVNRIYQIGIDYVDEETDNNIFPSDEQLRQRTNEVLSHTDYYYGLFWNQIRRYINNADELELRRNEKIIIEGINDVVHFPKIETNVMASYMTIHIATTLVSYATLLRLNEIRNEEIQNLMKVKFVTQADERVCPICMQYEGRIWNRFDPNIVIPHLHTHPRCRCRLLLFNAVEKKVL